MTLNPEHARILKTMRFLKNDGDIVGRAIIVDAGTDRVIQITIDSEAFRLLTGLNPLLEVEDKYIE